MPDPRGPQPDPRGQDPPDLLGDPDLGRDRDADDGRAPRPARARWAGSAPQLAPSSAPRCPRSSSACSASAAVARPAAAPAAAAAAHRRRQRYRAEPMSTFAFRAVDVAGVPSRGEVEAETQGAGHRAAAPARADRPRRLREARGGEARGPVDRFKSVGMRELAIFSRQFATLIASGMPMLRSLYTLEDQTEDEKLKRRDRGRAPGRRGGQLARRRDGAPPARSSTRCSARWSARARARAGSRRRSSASPSTSRSSTPSEAPDPLGDDVPGVRLRPRVRGHARRRRVHRPDLRRRVRGDRRRAARRERRAARS